MRTTYRAPGGKLIHVECASKGGQLERIKITGDFFLIPEDSIQSLEGKLLGLRADRASIGQTVADFFNGGRTLVGATPDDFVRAILLALGDASSG